MPDGGRSRVPSLVSIRASAPYFYENSLGRAFQNAIEKLLWPDRRLGIGAVYRTTAESGLVLGDQLQPDLSAALRTGGVIGAQERALRIGPIPRGMPIDPLANTNLELSARAAPRLVKLALDPHAALREIKVRGLANAAATARREGLVPDLLAVSKCPDFVADRGHLFGARLTHDDKHALIAFLKRL
jgi:hypothetical protein